MVPTFSGEDTDDIGGSARSYLRQIEAWRRMTYLPPAQQGLVLYQNLSGKAWIAAEELSVPRLGADGGVSYFVSWVNTRFLDIEVAPHRKKRSPTSSDDSSDDKDKRLESITLNTIVFMHVFEKSDVAYHKNAQPGYILIGYNSKKHKNSIYSRV